MRLSVAYCPFQQHKHPAICFTAKHIILRVDSITNNYHYYISPLPSQTTHLFVTREHEVVSGFHVDLKLLHIGGAVADDIGEGQESLDPAKGRQLQVHRDGNVLYVHRGQREGGAHIGRLFSLSEKHHIHKPLIKVLT